MPASTSVNLGLDIAPLVQESEALPDLWRLYGAVKNLAYALDSYTGALGAEQADWSATKTGRLVAQNGARLYVPFSEAVTPGQIVTLYNVAGALTAKKAGGASWQGGARGFVLTSVANGAWGEVFLAGVNSMITGMTPGTLYYTSNVTPGSITTGGTQAIGYALSSTELWFAPALIP